MKVYLLGCEQPTMARLAAEAGAKHVGLSFHSLYPRLPKRSEWRVAERLHGCEVYVASGGHSHSKKAGSDEQQSFLNTFEEWVENNASSLSLVTEFDGPLSLAERSVHRMRMQAMLGDRFVPVWDQATGRPGLEALANAFTTVGVSGEAARDNRTLSSLMVPLTNRLGTRWHALDGARPDDLFTGRFASAATTAWLSPMRFGETIVWDGTRMVRYQKKMKDQARRRHRSTFRQAGFDAEAILNDDNQEISRFTVWSFARLEEAVSRRKPGLETPFSDLPESNPVPEEKMSTFSGWNEEGEPVEQPPSDVDMNLPEVRNKVQLPTPRETRQVLPVVAFETKQSTESDADGNTVLVERPIMKKGTVTLRQCDTCHIAATCPGFQAGAECAYSIPIEIRTKDQILAVNYAMLEMQVERIAFMRLAEEQSGGYADPNLSQEMDRLFDIQKRIKDIEDNTSYVKITAEARGGMGVLSRLLGEKPQPQQVGSYQQPSIEYADAEIVEG